MGNLIFGNKETKMEPVNLKTSVKAKEFTKEPMGRKNVDVLPGIGEKKKELLNNDNFILASQIFGIYLSLNDNEKFCIFLKKYTIEDRYIVQIITIFDEYSSQFFR